MSLVYPYIPTIQALSHHTKYLIKELSIRQEPVCWAFLSKTFMFTKTKSKKIVSSQEDTTGILHHTL